MKYSPKNFLKIINSKQGFTLIELLVVISIIGLLSSVVLASLTVTRERARIAAGLQFAGNHFRTFGADAVGVYKFNESSGSTVLDSSGLDNHGVIQGTATRVPDVPSPGFGTPLLLNGTTDRVEITNSANDQDYVNLNSRGFTMMAWIKPTSLSLGGHGTDYVFMGKSIPMFYVRNTGILTIYFRGSGNAQAVNSPANTIQVGKWYHVAAVSATDGTMSLYVDGKLVGSGPSAYTFDGSTYTTINAYVGHHTTDINDTRKFAGNIDEVYFINRAMSVAEIQNYIAGMMSDTTHN